MSEMLGHRTIIFSTPSAANEEPQLRDWSRSDLGLSVGVTLCIVGVRVNEADANETNERGLNFTRWHCAGQITLDVAANSVHRLVVIGNTAKNIELERVHGGGLTARANRRRADGA